MSTWENKRVLITVRTYPTPAAKTAEQSCTAGITHDGKWIRLFPVPWRFLEDSHKFRKWEWIDLAVKKASDFRPESYNPDCDSIEIVNRIDTKNNWQERRQIIEPILAHCMCCLQRERNANKFPTLGVFRPRRIRRLIIERETNPIWTESEQEKLKQMNFRVINGIMVQDDNFKTLEKIPFKFIYDFSCDHAECDGHRMSCTDWEMGQAFRQWRKLYGNDWESKFRQRFEAEMIQKFDTHFFVGTTSAHPHVWVIVGTFRPMRASA